MRVIIYGVGAVGGTVAAGLARAGVEVLGIARGAMLEAIRNDGLELRGVETSFRVKFDCVAHPSEITFREDDVILLTMKTQDTRGALKDLRDAGVTTQAVYCAQNGVANESMAARVFPNVHGITVMMPCTYLTPGQIAAFCHPRFGIFELGRFPKGNDATDKALAEALEAGNVAAFVEEDVMAGKYGKLLLNLGNVLDAALGGRDKAGTLGARVVEEAREVYRAAGIAWRDVSGNDPRRQSLMKSGTVEGVESGGSSTRQSLSRGTGEVETDWLNGEISLLGRIHGVPTPLNDAMTRLGAKLARGEAGPGEMTLAEVEADCP